MIKHMFKLVWNRKRANTLIITEIFFSFLVLFAVAAFGVYYTYNYLQPLGFSYGNVWSVSLSRIIDADTTQATGRLGEEFRQTQMALRDLREVEGVAAIGMVPFRVGMSNGRVYYKGRPAETLFNEGSDDLKDVMGIKVVQGRWFDRSDDALSYKPVVINERLRDELFGSEDPLGREFDPPKDPARREREKPERVIGVITDFRQHGDFHALYNYCFRRMSMTDAARFRHMFVRLRPGTPAAFEERLMARLRLILKDRSIQIEPLSRARRSHMRLVLTPVVAGGLVAAFLIIMVGLGMVGVLWQNVSRRTREIGLRRALGGTATDVFKQVLGELILITTIGLLLGTAVAVQVPLLELVDWMAPMIFALGLAISVLVMYGLTIAAALYPSWLAAKVHPASALHYE